MAFTHHNHESMWLRARSPWPYQWRLWEILLPVAYCFDFIVPVCCTPVYRSGESLLEFPRLGFLLDSVADSRFSQGFSLSFSQTRSSWAASRSTPQWIRRGAVQINLTRLDRCASVMRPWVVSRAQIPLINAHQPKPNLKRWVMLFADESVKQSGSV